jgi:uncharacterized protein (TIGR02266 family)
MLRRKILVADDSPLFRDLESLFLARSGEVITSCDGELALLAARQERPAIVVADLHMPGMTGDALCRVIKADNELRDTPVILVTSGDLPQDHERAVRAGADDVIAKPINRITLIQAVNRLLRTRRPGLTRVTLETPVRLRRGRDDAFGTARNVSRGGMFVQATEPLPPDSEVELHFELPDAASEIAPTAKVVWRRNRSDGAAPGMGLQFLRLDRDSADRIDDFVYQYAAPEAPRRPARRSTGS